MADSLSSLLSNQLATNEQVLLATPLDFTIKVVTTLQLVQGAERQEGVDGPTLHRWNLRLASLISPQALPPLRVAGFSLLFHTYTQSTNSLLLHSKSTLAIASNLLSSPSPSAPRDPLLFHSALQLVNLILAKSTWHPEWARQVCGPAVVQRTVNALVAAAAAGGDQSEIKSTSVRAIVTLLPLFPTPLRPLSPSLHSLAITLLCSPSSPSNADEADLGAQLYGSLYLLAPKGREGLREAWRKGCESLIASVEGCCDLVTGGIFAEDPRSNPSLPPLALPPLLPTTTSSSSSSSSLAALERMESLLSALLLLLRTPTSERAGAVPVPLGACVELAVRLTGLNRETPIKERTDPSTIIMVHSHLPRLQLMGSQLIAQLGLAIGPPLLPHSHELLSTLAQTLTTYPRGSSPLRAALSTAYSLLLTSLGAGLDPQEGGKSLARVWRCVLEDVGGVSLREEVVVVKGKEEVKEMGGRKNKKQKMMSSSSSSSSSNKGGAAGYDPTESFEKLRAKVEELDLWVAERALATLETLLLSPSSHFLPPALQLSTARLLLFLTSSPSFFLTHPLPSSSHSLATFFPATSAFDPLEIAYQRLEFRRGVVRALKAFCERGGSSAGLATGVMERCAEVWRRGCRDRDFEISSLSHSALTSLSSQIHPLLPPQQVNTLLARQRAERVGGALGDQMVDLEEGSREFAKRRVEEREGVGMEMDSDEEQEEEMEEKSKGQGQGQGQGRDGQGEKMIIDQTSASSSVTTISTSGGFGNTATTGFASFTTAVQQQSQQQVVLPPPAIVEEEQQDSSDDDEDQDDVSKLVVPSVAVGGGSRAVAAQGDGGDSSDDDDDDEAMPVIHLDSEEE